MAIAQTEIAKRLRFAGILIGLGLIVELSTVAWNHPLGFLIFLAIGGLLMFLGVILYLWAVVSDNQPMPHASHRQLKTRAAQSD